MMLAARPSPTETELRAHIRSKAFRLGIELKATELRAAKMRAALERLGTPVVVPIRPEPPAPAQTAPAPRPAPVEPPVFISSPIAEIQKVVGRFYGASRADICSARRQKEIVIPRQVAMYLAKELTGNSMPAIGRKFGGRDHTTVLHACRKIRARMLSDADFAFDVATLIEQLGG